MELKDLLLNLKMIMFGGKGGVGMESIFYANTKKLLAHQVQQFGLPNMVETR